MANTLILFKVDCKVKQTKTNPFDRKLSIVELINYSIFSRKLSSVVAADMSKTFISVPLLVVVTTRHRLVDVCLGSPATAQFWIRVSGLTPRLQDREVSPKFEMFA